MQSIHAFVGSTNRPAHLSYGSVQTAIRLEEKCRGHSFPRHVNKVACRRGELAAKTCLVCKRRRTVQTLDPQFEWCWRRCERKCGSRHRYPKATIRPSIVNLPGWGRSTQGVDNSGFAPISSNKASKWQVPRGHETPDSASQWPQRHWTHCHRLTPEASARRSHNNHRRTSRALLGDEIIHRAIHLRG